MKAYPKNILIVDDETGILELLQRAFEGAGHNVKTAPSGRAALELIENEQPFDGVITDLDCPSSQEGLRVIQAANRKSLDTRIVLISGVMSESMVAVAQIYGALIGLQKPVKPMELIRLVA